MMLRLMKSLCYAQHDGRSGGRLCWRATCQGITRNGSSRRCVWDGEPYHSSSPHAHRIESRQCLKKRIFKSVDWPGADYLNQTGGSPFAAEPRQQQTAERRAEVATYYALAPDIVQAISADAQATAEWRRIMDSWLKPIIAAAERNDAACAHAQYRKMVKELQQKWLEPLRRMNG